MIELGDFRLDERVAHGGMADVWRGVHEPTETPVAVKLPSGGGDADPRLARAIHAEASAMATLRSSRIVQIHDVGVVSPSQRQASGGKLAEGVPWMAMEWVGGGTIQPVADWPELQSVLLDVGRALAHAHARGIVHRDVKPANVLIEARRPLRVKLADFGIAFARRAWLEASGEAPTPALTPMFAAPEQLGAYAGNQGPWTDLYQLGCLAWALTVGEPPFPEATDPRGALRAHATLPIPPLRPRFALPSGFEAWVQGLMAKRPGDRYGCAGDAVAALSDLDPEGIRRRRAPASVAPARQIVGPALATLRIPRLAGRSEEQQRLRALLVQAAKRDPRIVLVRGPSGVGTTALVDDLTQWAEERGIAAVVRGADEGGRTGLAGVCARALGIATGGTGPLDARVAAALETRGGSGPRAEALVALLEKRLDDRAERFEVAAATLAWRADRPLILAIDPPHDRGEILPFASWLASTRRMAVLTVIAASDERLAVHPAVVAAATDTIVLAPLSPGDTVSLVEDLGVSDTAAAARIATRSAGNAAVAVRAVRDRLLSELGTDATGGISSVPASDDTTESPESEWEERHLAILAAHPNVGPALEVAAALGNGVDADEWSAVCDALGKPLELGAVAVLTRRVVLAPDGAARYRFLQPAFRDSVLRNLGDKAKRLHRACAEVLEARGAEPDRIGAHRQDAGDVDGAFRLLVSGARLAGFMGDFVRAQAALDRASRGLKDDDPRLSEVLFNRIERARTRGATDEALHHVRHLLRLARANDSKPALRRAMLQRGALRVEQGDLGGLDDAAQAVEQSGPGHDRAEALCWYGMVLGTAGRLDESEARLSECVAHDGDQYVAIYGLGCIRQDQGRPAEALVRIDEALEIVAGRDDRTNDAVIRAMRSNVLRALGRVDEALAVAEDAELRLLAVHSGFVAEARVSIGFSRLALGKPDAAAVAFGRLLVETERARRMGVLGLAVAGARSGNDEPDRWLEAIDPTGLWMSRALDREGADLLDAVAPTLAPAAAEVARTKARAIRER